MQNSSNPSPFLAELPRVEKLVERGLDPDTARENRRTPSRHRGSPIGARSPASRGWSNCSPSVRLIPIPAAVVLRGHPESSPARSPRHTRSQPSAEPPTSANAYGVSDGCRWRNSSIAVRIASRSVVDEHRAVHSHSAGNCDLYIMRYTFGLDVRRETTDQNTAIANGILSRYSFYNCKIGTFYVCPRPLWLDPFHPLYATPNGRQCRRRNCRSAPFVDPERPDSPTADHSKLPQFTSTGPPPNAVKDRQPPLRDDNVWGKIYSRDWFVDAICKIRQRSARVIGWLRSKAG